MEVTAEPVTVAFRNAIAAAMITHPPVTQKISQAALTQPTPSAPSSVKFNIPWKKVLICGAVICGAIGIYKLIQHRNSKKQSPNSNPLDGYVDRLEF